jgi:Phage integrase family
MLRVVDSNAANGCEPRSRSGISTQRFEHVGRSCACHLPSEIYVGRHTRFGLSSRRTMCRCARATSHPSARESASRCTSRGATRTPRRGAARLAPSPTPAIRRDLPDLVAFMLATGARLGEACALRWSDVDFDRQLVSITGTVVRLPGKGLIISSTKTTTSNRVLRLPGWIAELLHARRDNAAKDLRPDVTPVFPAPLGGLRDRSNTGRGRSRAGSGWCRWTSWSCRRTTATSSSGCGSRRPRTATSCS